MPINWTFWQKQRPNGQHPEPLSQPIPVEDYERRMATELGDAMIAFWNRGQWWGWQTQFVEWLVANGHISEARYAIDQMRKGRRVHAPKASDWLNRMEKILNSQEPSARAQDAAIGE